MVKDLTKGNPTKVLLLFAIPLVLGNLFQQFYNIADSVVVGNFVGENALGAVGSSFPIMFLSIAVGTGMSTGCSVVISQYFGAERMDDVKSAIHTALLAFVVLGIVVGVLGQFIIDPMLKLLQSPPEIIEYSRTYLQWILGGTIFTFLYNICNAVFTALGDSKTPMYSLIFAAIINVALDLLFVIGFKMEVMGVAVATIIAQAMAGGLSYFLLRRRIQDIPSSKKPAFDMKLLKKMIHIAIPSTLQQSMVSIGMLAVQGLINSYGNVVVSGFTAAMKIDSIAMMPMMNMSNAVSTFTAQNIGANEKARIKQGYVGALKVSFIACVIISIIIFTGGHYLIGMFVDTSASTGVFEVGVDYLRNVSLFYFLMALLFVTSGVLRGSGDMKAFLASSTLNLSARILFAYMLAPIPGIGYKAIFWAIPIGWFCGYLVSGTRYLSGKWQHKAVIQRDSIEPTVALPNKAQL